MTVLRPGRRRVTMPRVRPAPEHNVIQNPAITVGIQRFAGIRQAHVSPTLADGLTPVVIAGDIREDPRTRLPESYVGLKELTADGVNAAYFYFHNPYTSDRIAVLRRFHAYATEGAAGPIASYIWYAKLAAASVSAAGVTAGARLLIDWSGSGVAPTSPVEPVVRNRSSAGWALAQTNGVPGGYIWRAPWFNANAAGDSFDEVLENFDNITGPRIILLPGANISFGIADATAKAYFNMWWDEYPLS
jgi:hypothetical protein